MDVNTLNEAANSSGPCCCCGETVSLPHGAVVVGDGCRVWVCVKHLTTGDGVKAKTWNEVISTMAKTVVEQEKMYRQRN